MRQAARGVTAARPAFCICLPSWREAGIVWRYPTEIREIAESFLARTKNAVGLLVMMGVNPDSIIVVTAMWPSHRTGQGVRPAGGAQRRRESRRISRISLDYVQRCCNSQSRRT